MGFKLVSRHGDMLSVMLRIKEEGEDVKVHLDGGKSQMYDGLIGKVDDVLALDISKGDIVVFDMVGAGEGADVLKRKGYTVIGGGKLNDDLELDRAFGEQFMRKHGIQVPTTHDFTDFDKARKFLEKDGGRYVFKPNGNLETDLTYVSTSAENLIGMLSYLRADCPDNVEFELQEFVDGTELSTEAWFNGERFLLPINSTMEEKKFMVGDYGANTGCMGNVVWFWPEDISQFLYETLFRPLEKTLRSANYMGPLDINCIWTEQGPYGLEYTARFGYDAIQALTRLFTVPISKFFRDMRSFKSMPVDGNPYHYSMAVRVSIPPFPGEGDVPEVPIFGITKSNKQNIYLSDVYMSEEGQLTCAGEDGYILAVCEDGNNLEQISKKIYSIIDTLELPNMQIRTDIGDRVYKGRKKLETLFHKLKRKGNG